VFVGRVSSNCIEPAHSSKNWITMLVGRCNFVLHSTDPRVNLLTFYFKGRRCRLANVIKLIKESMNADINT